MGKNLLRAVFKKDDPGHMLVDGNPRPGAWTALEGLARSGGDDVLVKD